MIFQAVKRDEIALCDLAFRALLLLFVFGSLIYAYAALFGYGTLWYGTRFYWLELGVLNLGSATLLGFGRIAWRRSDKPR